MRFAVALTIALAALAGCGGSDDDDGGGSAGAGRTATSTTAEGTPTGGEFVRRVDALCREANPELARTAAAIMRARDAARAGRASLPETFEAFAALLRQAGVTTDRLRTRLRAIEPPQRERAFHDALLRSLDQGAANLRRQRAAALARDARRLRDLSVRGSLINERGKGLIVGHGGFRHCGRR